MAMQVDPRNPNGRWVEPAPRWRTTLSEIGAGMASLAAVGLHALLGRSREDRVGILMYHRCSPRTPRVPRPTINVTPRALHRQLAGLQRRGYEFWPLRRVLEAASAGEAIPPRVVVVTFDDGYEGVYLHAARILRELAIPATVFVNTAYLGSSEPFPFDHWGQAYRDRAAPESYRPMTLEQCRELLEDGIELGAHTHTHEDFRGRPQEFFRDLEQNIQRLEQHFGIIDPSFAFPYGAPHCGFVASELVAAARASGVRCGLTTASALVDPQTDPFHWGRLHVFSWDTPQTLDARLNGWYSWAPRMRQRICSMRLPAVPRAGTPASSPTAGLAPNAAAHAAGLDPHRTDPGTRPRISVVMPTFNRCEWVGAAVRSLQKLRTDGAFEYEIVVVDNASTDTTAAVVAEVAAESPVPLRYVLQTKPGDAPTRNAGIREARGEWIAFFDDDQYADPDWLRELYRAAVTTGAQVIGGPVHLDLTDEQLHALGPICRQALREIALSSRLTQYGPRQLPGTGNALVARELFERLGAFDESMTRGGSDSDFFKRARAAGYPLWYAPRAIIRHRVPAERLTREYLRWDALSGGAGHAAHFDYCERGVLALCTLCAARVSKALLLHVPGYALEQLRGRSGRALGHRTRIWRAEGYLRKTLSVLAPRWFPQTEFFASLDFRHGRIVASSTTTTPPPAAAALAAPPQRN